ncbi:putative endoplasmic reticulum membrane protein C16E8.02 [Prunus yedoensis var. nudiflora]|uniref:Putative endoplasmic reticulum membrane protein C16E8.02 n=1 Tax=Prunus yedoensis var. nudiflora TaxID=2094558 RepID=A0A314YU52_PRUYE|nr:putative endoplasmic reticulum membrane protein C16E8.02 [Prunus yedoensis var. nudiflora]
MGRTGLFDLERHFAFYGAYHNNPVNILIHTVFVWPIVFTSLVLLYFTPSLYTFPAGLSHGFLLNFGFVFTVIYALFYVCLDKKAGSLAALLCVLCWVGASLLAGRLGFSLAWKVVLAAQLFCWTGQFIGHGVFEKRAPALLDNLVQAFLMAPYFVLLEVLQTAFGYEPYPGFHASVKEKIDANLKEWHEKKQKKIS